LPRPRRNPIMALNSLKEMSVVDPFRALSAECEHDVQAGKHLVIESSPSGLEILDEECPAGKLWHVTIHVDVKEVDA
jgi:hypothetical protein